MDHALAGTTQAISTASLRTTRRRPSSPALDHVPRGGMRVRTTAFQRGKPMNQWKLIFLTLVITLLAGCGTTRLQGAVTRFHTLDGSPKTFAIFPLENQQDSLEFRAYAKTLSNELMAKGWKEELAETADVAIFLEYAIGGKTVTRSYPIFKQVPFGNATTTGTISSSGQIQATTTQATTLAVAGTGTYTDEVFVREVNLKMFSMPIWRASKKMEPVFDGTINSTGTTGQLPVVMPTLIRALLHEFPGRSGSSTTVALPISP